MDNPLIFIENDLIVDMSASGNKYARAKKTADSRIGGLVLLKIVPLPIWHKPDDIIGGAV